MRDDLFIRGEAPMTKEAIRAIVLSQLNLWDAKGLLDIGAGTGSIGIEAKATYPNLRVVSLEQHHDHCQLIAKNCLKFGLKDIEIVEDRAPSTHVTGKLDRFFIGGSEGSLELILQWILSLSNTGMVVATAITLETQHSLIDLFSREPFQSAQFLQVQVNQVTPLGSGHYLKPQNPIFIARAHFNVGGGL